MAAEIFVKIADIPGESADAQHRGEIEVLSYAWGMAHPTSAASGGAATGKVTFHDLSFTHHIDKASPKLMEACARNRRLPEVTISHRRAAGQQLDFLTLKLTNAVVTSISTGDTAGGGTESVTLAFAKVDFSYKPQKPDGSLDTAVTFLFDTTTHA